MSKLSQTTNQLLNIFEHIEIATVQHCHDNDEARRIITAAFRNAAMIGGIPNRPSPASDLDDISTVIAAGASLKDWVIENIVVPWEIDELKAAFDNVVDHYWSAIGSDVVMTAVEPKLGKNGGTVDDWLNIGKEFQAIVDTWVQTRDRHPIRYHHIRMQPVGKGKLKCFHEFCVDTLRQEISFLERAAFVLYVAYLKRRLSDPTCEHVIDSIKELQREITKFRDKATSLMKMQEPEIRERIKLIPFEERERHLSITGLQYYMNAVEERVREHEGEGEDADSMGSEKGSGVEIDLRGQAIIIGDNRVPFGGKGALWPVILKLVESYQKEPETFIKWKDLIPEDRPDLGGENIRGYISDLKKHFQGSGATILGADRSKGEQGYRFQVVIGKY